MHVCVCNIRQYDSLWLLAASFIYFSFPTSFSYQLYPLSRAFPPLLMVTFYLPVVGFPCMQWICFITIR